MELNSNRHSVFRLQFHLVVVTKYRLKVINQQMNVRLKELAHRVFEECWGLKILEIDIESDHVHLCFEYNPQTDHSKLVNNFKTVSSRMLRKEFSEHLGKIYQKPYLWANSYCILSVGGTNIDVIKQYIEKQRLYRNRVNRDFVRRVG